MEKSYVITGLITLLVAVLAWTQARKFPFQDLEAGLGPAFFPSLLLVTLVILSFGSIIYGFFSEQRNEKKQGGNHHYLNAIVILCLLIIYGIAFNRIGFLWSTFLFLLVSMYLLRTTWWVTLVLSFLLTGTLCIIFIVIFNIPLP